MISIRLVYLAHIIFIDAVPTENQQFSAEAQIAGPSGFISVNIVGLFETAILATNHATRWVKVWIDSGYAERALSDAFNIMRA